MRFKRHWYALWAQRWRVKGSDITCHKRHTNATRAHTCTHPYPRCKNQIILQYKHFRYVFMYVDIKVEPSQEDQEWRRITRQSSRFSKHTGSCFHVLRFGFCRKFWSIDASDNRMHTYEYFFVRARERMSVYTRSKGAVSHEWSHTRAHTSDCTQYYCLTLSYIQ